jgi:hypothetical protein
VGRYRAGGSRPAAWLLVFSGPLGMAFYDIRPILERIDRRTTEGSTS